MKISYPEALKAGDWIGITAPSTGGGPEHIPRLELALNHLRQQGFQVEEGHCLRQRHKHVSGPREARAKEFVRFWKDPKIKAIMPPWGGEILVEILPILDFADLAKSPAKWVSGYSDISTLLFALTLKTGIASLHGSNLLDLVPTQKDPLTTSLMKTLQLNAGQSFLQESSRSYQKQWKDFRTHVDSPLNLTEETCWKSLHGQARLEFSGRLIGGCLDTIARLVGTSFGDVPRFVREAGSTGVILYFENCEMAPPEVVRTLWNLRLAGWFERLSGLLIGRSAGPEASSPAEQLTYVEALHSVLADLPLPILYDVDIGHRPPQLNLINGSLGHVRFAGTGGNLLQELV